MPRRPRLDAPGAAHHVWVRGVDRRDLFLDDGDRDAYLNRLARVLPEEGVRSLAWAVLANHAHFVLLSGSRPLSHALHRVGTAYAGRFNARYGHEGYVFQGRFGSRLIDGDGDLRNVLRYVHRNPVAAGVVASLEELERHPWAGHAALMARSDPLPFQDVATALRLFGGAAREARAAYRTWMEGEPPASEGPVDEISQLDALIAMVCRDLGVEEWAVRAGRRFRGEARAREIIARAARSELRLSEAVIADALGVSRQALWQRLGARRTRVDREVDNSGPAPS